MRCQSCNMHKDQLKIKKSKLLPQSNFNLCNRCIEGDYEPRWAIIIAGRSLGVDTIKDYIINHKYIGDEIALKDIMK